MLPSSMQMPDWSLVFIDMLEFNQLCAFAWSKNLEFRFVFIQACFWSAG